MMRRLFVATVVLALSLGSGCTLAAEEEPPATGAFEPAGSLAEARVGHTATLLLDGQIEALDGCSGVTVIGDEADGEYGIFVLWDSEAAADAAAGVISPQLSKHLAGTSLGAPDIRLFEVLSR